MQQLEFMGTGLMKNTEREASTVTISSAAQVLPLVRRQMAIDLAIAAIFLCVVAVGPYWLTGSTKILYIAPFLILPVVLVTYAGRYIPLSNKHDSLFNKYGDIYVEQISSAVKKHGIRTLINTRWFETYADEDCRNAIDD